MKNFREIKVTYKIPSPTRLYSWEIQCNGCNYQVIVRAAQPLKKTCPKCGILWDSTFKSF